MNIFEFYQLWTFFGHHLRQKNLEVVSKKHGGGVKSWNFWDIDLFFNFFFPKCDNSWPFLMSFDSFLTNFDHFWKFLMSFDVFLTLYGNFCRFLTLFWRFLTLSDTFWHSFWRFLTLSDTFWQFLTIFQFRYHFLRIIRYYWIANY